MNDAKANGPLLALDGIGRTFIQGGNTLQVLRGASAAVDAGEIVALVGPSGAGKSTLLQIAGLLERPTTGDVRIDGQSASRLSDSQRTELRRTAIGFVYQFHHLLPEFTAAENVAMPRIIAGASRREATRSARDLLARVGLAQRVNHRPARLSGGEQQRVAIVRALANTPRLLLADEPTGNLDPHTAEGVFEMLGELVRGSHIGALIATHNLQLARRMDRVLELRDGLLHAV